MKKRQEDEAGRYPLWDNYRYALNRLNVLEGRSAFLFCGTDILVEIIYPFLAMALPSAVKLFSFPVWENIVTAAIREEEKIWHCLKQAGAEEIVKNMPEGLETYLYKNRGDGVEISGGEAQKIALSRALYKDAPIVILDEPTADLDPISEAEIYAGFDEMVKDKTSIYISHRMSSCRFCDDIIVFDQGKIIERGSHEDLLNTNGQYAALWNAQAKYYAT